MSATIAIAAGGTGGHLLPGFAIARAIQGRAPGTEVVFIGTERGLESELVPRAGYRVRTTTARPFGRGLPGVAAAASLIPAVRTARRILQQERAGVVIGMGGYPSVPAVIAARIAKVPSIVHEANAVPGLANQFAARFTPNVAVAFASAVTGFGSRRPRVTGMPLRPEVVTLDRATVRAEACEILGLRPDLRTILAFGGSLGARRITEAMADAARAWPGGSERQVLLVAGREGAAHARETLRAVEHAVVEPYVERMDLAYAAADLVVSRAGSSSVNEIAAVGLPAILVPYPHARRREQHANASLLTEAGAALVLDDAELTGERLGAEIDRLLSDPGALAGMAEAARGVARVDAAERIADWALELKDTR